MKYQTVEELQALRERLTQIISKKNAYITFLQDEMNRKESYWRQELLKVYQEEKRTYKLKDIAEELGISTKKLTKVLKKQGILEEVKIGSAIRLHLTKPYQHLHFDVTSKGYEPTYYESTFYLYTQLGKQFIINAYRRGIQDE
jgi:AraC-like DNA-binding protein